MRRHKSKAEKKVLNHTYSLREKKKTKADPLKQPFGLVQSLETRENIQLGGLLYVKTQHIQFNFLKNKNKSKE